MADHQQLLRDVGGSAEPPICYKQERVGPVYIGSDGESFPGWAGRVLNREGTGFVWFRQNQAGFVSEANAYRIPNEILHELRAMGVTIVLIAEEDTKTVYEWHISQFGDSVPKYAKPTNRKEVPMTFAYISESWGSYPNHCADVLIGDRVVSGE